MKILFIQQTYNLGGVNVVTANLANKFSAEGHEASIFAFSAMLTGTETIISSDVHTYTGRDHRRFCMSNVKMLRSAILKEEPDLIVNNWGLPWRFITTVRLAMVGIRKKPVVWSMYHSAPQANSTIIRFEQKSVSSVGIKHAFFQIICRGIKLVTVLSFRYVYNLSDGYILLCKSYAKEFCEFTRIKQSSKIWYEENPLTIQNDGFELFHQEKQKELLFVGRIEPNVKKVFRLLDVWQIVSKKFPDWRITIVGDGPDKERLELLAKTKDLKNIAFVGKQRPNEYYQRASILCMCSDFEGFPLAVVEAMAFGCVPVVYGSFSSIYDIVTSGRDGVIVEKQQGRFSVELMAKALAEIMSNSDLRYSMMIEAKKSSERHSIENIYQRWMEKVDEYLA